MGIEGAIATFSLEGCGKVESGLIFQSRYLEIDNTSNFYLIGAKYNKKIGFYSSKFIPDIFNLVVSAINCIQLDSLNQYYEASWTDDQTCGVLIQTTDTIYKSSAYGVDREPAELSILLYTLMEVYKIVELTEDAIVQQNFQHWNFQNEIYPNPNKR